jgi:hypothetical protein
LTTEEKKGSVLWFRYIICSSTSSLAIVQEELQTSSETHRDDTPQPLQHLSLVAAVQQLAHLVAIQQLGARSNAARGLGSIERELSGCKLGRLRSALLFNRVVIGAGLATHRPPAGQRFSILTPLCLAEPKGEVKWPFLALLEAGDG